MTFTHPQTLTFNLRLRSIDTNKAQNKGHLSIQQLLLSDRFSKCYLSDKRAVKKQVISDNAQSQLKCTIPSFMYSSNDHMTNANEKELWMIFDRTLTFDRRSRIVKNNTPQSQGYLSAKNDLNPGSRLGRDHELLNCPL